MSVEIDPRDEAYQCFLQEALEHLQVLESGLLNIRDDHSTNQINNLMRAAHSLKGGSALFRLTEIQDIAHDLETAFRSLYRLEKEVDLELEELLLQAYDCLRYPLLDQLEKGSYDATPFTALANETFDKIKVKLGHSLDGQMPMSGAHLELVVNSNSLIWSQVIQQELSSLSKILEQQPSDNLLEILLEKCRGLFELGTSFDLPGLVIIAQTTLGALEDDPESVQMIAELTLEDLKNLHEELLENKENTSLPDATEPNNSQQKSTPEEQNKLVISNTQSLGVRVDLHRLDNLNNLVGDLVTHENSFLLQNQQQKNISERLNQWMKELQQLQFNLTDNINDSISQEKDSLIEQLLKTLPSKNYKNSQEIANNLIKQITETVVDQVMHTLSESTTKIEEIVQDILGLNQQGKQIFKKRQQTLKQVQDSLMQVRMLPCHHLLNQFPRMIRDLATKYQKQVTLKLTGSNTLVDKSILEKLSDPLVHLVRNSFDHGIEMPEVRQSKGKNPQGTIEINTYHRGNYTYIEIRDDGSGIDLDKIRAKAVHLNLISTDEAATLSKDKLYEFIFKPGFSTTDQVSELSGRGVGLDTVLQEVSALKGSINISSEPGIHTTFTLRLPFTITVTQLLVFTINGTTLAIPVDELAATVAAFGKDIELHSSQEYYLWQGESIPLITSLSLPSYNVSSRSIFSGSFVDVNRSPTEEITLFILSQGSKGLAIKIDQIVMQEDLVIKPFTRVIKPPSYLLGCTILGDGRLIPVLDGQALVSWWYKADDKQLTYHQVSESFNQKFPTILIVDDSPTIRQNLSVILRKEGYQIFQAENGSEALEKLRQRTEIRAVISDIDMPKMNGIEFLSNYHQEFANSDIPIIMLTSRDSDNYRELAKRLGATAYLTKPYLELELLETLHDCLNSKKVSTAQSY